MDLASEYMPLGQVLIHDETPGDQQKELMTLPVDFDFYTEPFSRTLPLTYMTSPTKNGTENYVRVPTPNTRDTARES